MGRNYKWLDKDMLTPRQLKLYNYLKEYKKENQYMPTYKDMMKYMHIKSSHGIHQMLGYMYYLHHRRLVVQKVSLKF